MKSYATKKDERYRDGREEHLQKLSKQVPLSHLIDNFAKYVRRQELTRFLARHDLFRMIHEMQGCIVECGVAAGQGVMTWAQLSAILEPVGGAFRHVYGFDTFKGFPGLHKKDKEGTAGIEWKKGDFRFDSWSDLNRCIELFNDNMVLPQFPKVTLVKGDFRKTGRTFLKKNPHILISLLYLDFDLYEPTKLALELFLPRMAKGSILCFDEINHPLWPGETQALLEKMNLREVKIRKFSYEVNMSYIVL